MTSWGTDPSWLTRWTIIFLSRNSYNEFRTVKSLQPMDEEKSPKTTSWTQCILLYSTPDYFTMNITSEKIMNVPTKLGRNSRHNSRRHIANTKENKKCPPGQRDTTAQEYIFKNMQQPLVSIPVLFDNECEVTFTKQHVQL